jgi:hypothetical protein
MNAKKCYVIVCDIEGGIEIDSVWLDYYKAFDRLQELKNERNDVFAEYDDDCIVFENDDAYYIKESEIKE